MQPSVTGCFWGTSTPTAAGNPTWHAAAGGPTRTVVHLSLGMWRPIARDKAVVLLGWWAIGRWLSREATTTALQMVSNSAANPCPSRPTPQPTTEEPIKVTQR